MGFDEIGPKLAERLRDLRLQAGFSLEVLADKSGVSRATLSRLENAEVSPTAEVLGRICSAYGLSISRLLYLAEQAFTALVPLAQQARWQDQKTGFQRRSVSPPSQDLAGEVIGGELPAGVRIAYDKPHRPGAEHHLVLTKGRLTLTSDGKSHALKPGDCLRYKEYGATIFETPAEAGASYFIFLVA